MRAAFLGILLFCFWLALSGHYTWFLVGAGLSVSALAALAVVRMRINDGEGLPIGVLAGIPRYYPWLIFEILKSAWTTAVIILHPKLPISPVMTAVAASQKTTTGIATYANSITLTPGTVTTEVKGHQLTVYALTREIAEAVEAGHMDRRVSRFEGEK